MDSTPYVPINSLRPSLTWTTGGGGINATPAFRVKMDDPDLTVGASVTNSSVFVPPANLTEGAHTLYVQERDAAGNWSTASSRKIIVASAGTVGSPGISDGEAYYTNIAFNRDKAPCVSYSDHSQDSKAAVRCFTPANGWQPLGAQAASTEMYVSNPVLRFNGTGAAIIAHGSQNMEMWASRLPYGGSTWNHMARIDTGITYDAPAIAFNSSGEPLVAYGKYQSETDSRVYVNVKRYTGTGWSQSGYFFPANGIGAFAMATNPSGAAYVAYNEQGTSKISLEFQAATSWSQVSIPAITGSVFGLEISASGVIFLAYQASNALKVLRGDNGTWTHYPDVPFDPATQTAYRLRVDPDGNPFLLLKDTPASGSGSPHLGVRAFSGNAWRRLKKSDFVAGAIMSADLAISPEGVPYVGFTEQYADIKVNAFKTAIDP